MIPFHYQNIPNQVYLWNRSHFQRIIEHHLLFFLYEIYAGNCNLLGLGLILVTRGRLFYVLISASLDVTNICSMKGRVLTDTRFKGYEMYWPGVCFNHYVRGITWCPMRVTGPRVNRQVRIATICYMISIECVWITLKIPCARASAAVTSASCFNISGFMPNCVRGEDVHAGVYFCRLLR